MKIISSFSPSVSSSRAPRAQRGVEAAKCWFLPKVVGTPESELKQNSFGILGGRVGGWGVAVF